MPQVKFRVDINETNFPLLSDWAGRTVMQAQGDVGQHHIADATAMYQPGTIYLQDVLPTAQGYKSVSYKQLIAAASPANTNFSNIYTVADANQNKALVGITADSHIYMLTNASHGWVDVTPVGWAGGDLVTVGDANGTFYLYLYKFGCYQVVISPAPSLTATALTGITAANIHGILSAIDYLILWDSTTIYWSSTINPLDFTPSLATGAGSAVPYDESGQIVTCVQLNNGFAVYTTTNIVLASFSNNTQFPWIFRNANNSSGVSNYKQVSYAHELAFHVALTYAGVTQVTPQGAEMINPEVTDFLAARIYETFDFVNNVIQQTQLTSNLLTRITVIGARWIALSYGINSYTDILVFDIILNRWGKLHVNHVACFELETNMEGVIQPYNAASEVGQSYAAASPQTYTSTAVTLNNPPQMGRIIGLLQADGTTLLAYLNYISVADNAVLMLGKYQFVRSNMIDLEEIAVENTQTNTNFNLMVIPSINGKDTQAAVQAVPIDIGAEVTTYGARMEVKNFIALFLGTFNLTTVETTANLGGRR